MGKPPYCEVTFKAISDDSTPPDLTVTIIFGDVKKPTNTFTISRVAETPEGQIHYKLYIQVLLSLPCYIVALKEHKAVASEADESSSSSRPCK